MQRTPGMANWTDLEQSLRDAGRRRTEELRLAEERARARLELDAWAFDVVPAVMDQVARGAALRARDLGAATGYAIDVAYPVRTTTGPKDVFPLHVVALRLEPVEVDVYSARGAGGLPVLHVVSFVRTAAPRERRLVSEPGCLVSRQADGGWQLLSLNPQGSPATLEDLLHRAFSRLVRHWSSGLLSQRLS